MKKTRILVLGAGFAGTYALKRLHKRLHKRKHVEITVVNDTNYFLFTPLLHEVATGAIKPNNILEPIRKVFTCCHISVRVGNVRAVDTKQKEVLVNEEKIGYDYLIMAMGSETNYFGTAGAAEHCFTLKSLDDALDLKGHYISLMDRAATMSDREARRNLLHTVIIGAGPTGVELAAETAELFFHSFSKYYPQDIIDDVAITLVQRGSDVLPAFDPYVRRKALETLERNGVDVMLNTAVDAVGPSSVHLSSGNTITTHTAIWVAGIKAASFDINAEKNSRGCLVVGPTLQLIGHKDVFVVGDLAYCENPHTKRGMPALAQVAVAQGELAADNILALMQDAPLKHIHVKLKGMLVSLGQWRAAAEIGKIHFSGRFAWWMWRTVYLSKLLSWRKRLQVAVDWTIELFAPRDISNV